MSDPKRRMLSGTIDTSDPKTASNHLFYVGQYRSFSVMCIWPVKRSDGTHTYDLKRLFMRHEIDIDYTKQAADHLREESKRLGASSVIKSGHAHMLVAAAFGYNTRKAMQDDPKGPYFHDQWLSSEAGDVEKIKEVIGRMNGAPVQPEQAPLIAGIIQDGLTPACIECGTHSSHSEPLGLVEPGDDSEWVCPSCARDEYQYGRCRCCGDDKIFRLEDLDDQGLCKEHEGEFDYSQEELDDMESYIENVQKDG